MKKKMVSQAIALRRAYFRRPLISLPSYISSPLSHALLIPPCIRCASRSAWTHTSPSLDPILCSLPSNNTAACNTRRQTFFSSSQSPRLPAVNLTIFINSFRFRWDCGSSSQIPIIPCDIVLLLILV